MSQKLGANQTLLRSVQKYAEYGWSVFQLIERNGKLKPLTKAKEGGARWDATTDFGEIKQRWTKNSNAGIGIVTGKKSGLLVVDVDSMEGHGVDGLTSLRALTEKHEDLPDTVMANMPSGGRHVYFKYPVNRKINIGAGIIAQGIDHRANGDFIVAPPENPPALAAGINLEQARVIADLYFGGGCHGWS
jgi:putative DNA primase/helicase